MGDYNSKNYTECGGDKTVIGGTLEILPGAEVKGLPGGSKMGNQPSSKASTVAGLRDDLNALLAKLKLAGYMDPDDSAL